MSTESAEEKLKRENPELWAHLDAARHWKCQCGERCNPCSGSWRWSGYAWEHHHGTQAGHFEAEFRKLAAHNTGDGWYLHELDEEENVIDENGLEWPHDWPLAVNAEFLKSRGYEIV